MNFIIKDINQIKKISITDKITLVIYSLIPCFLIIGTGVSEVGIIVDAGERGRASPGWVEGSTGWRAVGCSTRTSPKRRL